MQKKLKLAFIGGSIESIAGRPHFAAIRMDGRFELVAGAFSRDESINQKTAKAWGVERCYQSWESLIEAEVAKVDAVVVLAPTPQHADIVSSLLYQEVPVICEKPIVSSLDEIGQLKAIFNKGSKFLCVTNNYSGYPMVRELRERIRSGAFGRLLHFRLEMPQESFMRPPRSVKYPQKWRLTDGVIPMISLDLGTHLHHLARFITEEAPKSVLAHYESMSKYNVVDEVNIWAKYSGEVLGNFWISKVALGNRNGLKIKVYGEKASAEWCQMNSEYLHISYSDGTRLQIDRASDLLINMREDYNRMTPGHPAGFIEAFANIYGDIYLALDNHQKGKDVCFGEYLYGLDHAEEGLKFLHSASMSNKQRRWIDIL